MADEEIRLTVDESEEGAPAWFVSFADLMSILLTFFVLMVSFSQMDLAKFKELANSLEQAFGAQRQQLGTPMPADTMAATVKFQERLGLRPQAPVVQAPAPAPATRSFAAQEAPDTAPQVTESTVPQAVTKAAEPPVSQEPAPSPQTVSVSSFTAPQPTANATQGIAAALQTTAAELQTLLTNFAPQGMLELEAQDHYLVMRLLGQTTFASGKAELRPEVVSTLQAIGQVVRQTPYEIFVAGHTDDVPIRSSVFKSNLELSAARAAVVVDFFVRQGLVAPARIATMGFGEYRPLVPNTSEANREQNRRVEIILTARPAQPSAPSPIQPAPTILPSPSAGK